MKHIEEIVKSKTKTERKTIEKKYGIRYTPFLELSYYDAISFNVIDPMHNLFLGIAKTMFKIWTDDKTGIITSKDIELINQHLKEIKTSHGMAALPQNIGCNWGGCTAHEWKVWTITYVTV